MTAQQIINRLMRGNTRKDFTLPNYTPDKWWECDVIQVRPSGRWIEYEVKMSRSDFKVDATKSREVGPYVFGQQRPTVLKHDLLQNTEEGPNFFYFVAPKGMLSLEEIPIWAGLIEVWESSDLPEAPSRKDIQIHTTREAPLRHKMKIADTVRSHALSVCYWRYHELRRTSKQA